MTRFLYHTHAHPRPSHSQVHRLSKMWFVKTEKEMIHLLGVGSDLKEQMSSKTTSAGDEARNRLHPNVDTPATNHCCYLLFYLIRFM